MSRLTFNREPWFDDFDADKNYYQILFRPKRSLQIRELNQLQSILSHQTETFANHIFKFGSMVKSGSIKFKNFQNYVRLKDLTPTAQAVDYTRMIDKRVRGKTSGLLAEIIHIEPKDEFDPDTLYVNYKNTAVDGETSAFINGETLEVLDAQGYATYEVIVRCPDCAASPESTDVHLPTGQGSLFSVDDTVFYIHGKFVSSPMQTIVLDKYEVVPSYKIGFDIVQRVITSADDSSLNDNALGTTNYSAPGADRLQIKLNLTKKLLSDEDDENFVLLAKVDAGFLQEIKDKPQYADLMDTLARRTYDESGDYTVKPFTVKFMEHLKADDNPTGGWKTLANGGDEDKMAVIVSPGKAYVRGRLVEKIAESVIEVNKARDTEQKRSAVIRPEYGNYILVKLDSVSNIIPNATSTTSTYFNDFQPVSLYDAVTSGGTATGNFIGRLRVKGMELVSGTAGTTGAIWKLFVFDIQMEPNRVFGQVRGMFKSGTTPFAANVEPDAIDATYKVYEPINNNLLFKLPYQFNKSIRDADNPLASNTSTVLTKKLVAAANASGIVTFSTQGGETFLSYNSQKWIGGVQAVSGSYIPFNLIGAVTTSPTSITVNLGVGNASKNFLLVCEVLQSSANDRTKVMTRSYLNNIAADVQTISLLKADAWKVVSVKRVSDNVDVTADWELVKNVKDNYYDISYLKLKSGVTEYSPGVQVNIVFDYFQHTGTGYYFSVDSYTAIINDPAIDFGYEDIPVHTTKDGEIYRLADAIDFRPTAGQDGTFTGANAALLNLPTNQSNIIFDIEYYLPRIDTICVDESGEIFTVEGIPSLTPVQPAPAENSMPIYYVTMDAYVFDVKRNVKTKFIDNKRYTMKDIGRLEKRLNNLEYYVTFNLLEQATSDLSVLDSSGNERFKNGFLVDNFKDFIAADTGNSEYNAAIDAKKGELRPSFLTKSVKLALNIGDSSNYVKHGNVVTLPYTTKVFNDQPFATKSISVNPYFIFNKEGIIKLNPDSDVWKDVTTQPDLVVDIDTGWEDIREIANAAGVLGTTWNSWETTSQTSESRSRTDIRTDSWNNWGWWGNRSITSRTTATTTTATTTTSQQTRTGINRSIEEDINNYSLGENVTSVNLVPYIRSIDVQFAATGLLPNTKVYAFFDGIDVNDECRALNGVFTSDMVTDAEGNLLGVFRIPNNENKRFFTGSRIFRLTNTPDNNTDPDQLTTSAETEFFSGGLAETRRETMLSVSSPKVVNQDVSENRTVRSTNVTQSSRTTVNTRFRRACWCCGCSSGDDPLAQSFTVSDETGVYLTSANIYFQTKSEDTPVWFQIRNMDNGYPGPVVAPYSEVWLKPKQVKTSEDATVATEFVFEAPVFLAPDTEYCFVIGSSDKAYRIFVSKLGGITIGDNPVQVSSQPHLGSLFKSQNDKTWTAEQFEDIKFELNRAVFSTSQTMSLVFENEETNQKALLRDNPFETQLGSQYVRVYHKNHGLVANDKVKLDMVSDTWYTIHLTSGHLIVGQELVGPTNGGVTAKATIKDLAYVGINSGNGAEIYNVKLSGLIGWWDDMQNFSGNVYYENFTNSRILATLDISPQTTIHQVALGYFPTGLDSTFNGIPIGDFSSAAHLVQYVDSIDSYVIQVDTAATVTGFTGGSGTYAVGNIQVDAFNFQATYIDWDGTGKWTVGGISHGGIGSTVLNYQSVAPFTFEPNENVILKTPMKIANTINEATFLGAGVQSIQITGTFSTGDDRITPIFNIDSQSFTTITNRVDYLTCAINSVAPNATTDGAALICDPSNPSYNARFVQETEATGGSEGAKYIMKPVVLKNPASAIKVYMDVLKFLDTDVQVYYRTLASESDDEIVNQPWVYAAYDEDVISEADSDFKEVEISIPDAVGGLLPEFKAFQVKLIMKSKNSSKPPKVKKFRAIAVT